MLGCATRCHPYPQRPTESFPTCEVSRPRPPTSAIHFFRIQLFATLSRESVLPGTRSETRRPQSAAALASSMSFLSFTNTDLPPSVLLRSPNKAAPPPCPRDHSRPQPSPLCRPSTWFARATFSSTPSAIT